MLRDAVPRSGPWSTQYGPYPADFEGWGGVVVAPGRGRARRRGDLASLAGAVPDHARAAAPGGLVPVSRDDVRSPALQGRVRTRGPALAVHRFRLAAGSVRGDHRRAAPPRSSTGSLACTSGVVVRCGGSRTATPSRHGLDGRREPVARDRGPATCGRPPSSQARSTSRYSTASRTDGGVRPGPARERARRPRTADAPSRSAHSSVGMGPGAFRVRSARLAERRRSPQLLPRHGVLPAAVHEMDAVRRPSAGTRPAGPTATGSC